ncbi:MAG: TAT-variant-translocated molybdopterin oxidoreductase, partial [Planctomycetota bacterium]
MSSQPSHEQCPSSKKEGLPAEMDREPRDVSAITGREYWTSAEELADTPEFRSFLEREFPAGASELLDSTRRSFLKVMGASLALAGAATLPGCRRPDHKILAYEKEPEHIILGKPLFYATAFALPEGGSTGLIVESFEGRPVKLEGNPLHPRSRGAISAKVQSAILDMYDPDRDPELINARHRRDSAHPEVTPWSSFANGAKQSFSQFDTSRGAGLFFLVGKKSSPTRERLVLQLKSRWPEAQWLPYEACESGNRHEGLKLAFGRPASIEHKLENADVILSLDADFLCAEGLREHRGWAKNRIREGTRKGAVAHDTTMSRVYQIESTMSATGGQADHRLAVKPTDIASYAAIIAQGLGLNGLQNIALPEKLDQKLVDAIVADLASAGRRAVVIAGEQTTPEVHALVATINDHLGAIGSTVVYRPVDGDAASSSADSVATLAAALDADQVDTLVVIDANPAFTGPTSLDLSNRLAKAKEIIHLGEVNETAAFATTHLSRTHFLEEWNDVRDIDGTISVVQPMIKPLFDSHSDIELLATILDLQTTDAFELVRETMRAGIRGDFEKSWRLALHNGVVAGTEQSVGPVNLATNSAIIGASLRNAPFVGTAVKQGDIQLTFLPDESIGDGSLANNGWLQELPETVSKVTWDNPLRMSKATAESLGLNPDHFMKGQLYNRVDVAEVTIDGVTVNCPIWVQPGMPDGVVEARFGNGRRLGGRVAMGAGTDVYPLRGTASAVSLALAVGVSITDAKGESPAMIACTQHHWKMKGRNLIREIDLPAWQKFGDVDFGYDEKYKKYAKDAYGAPRDINFAAMFGLESHTPANRSIYNAKQEHYYFEIVRDERGNPVLDDKTDRAIPLREHMVERDARGHMLMSDKGHPVAKKREDWPKYKDKEPKSELQKRKAWGEIIGALNDYGKRTQQWGMTIDLTTCTGCGSCVVACQAENNIPVVGKAEVAKGREM